MHDLFGELRSLLEQPGRGVWRRLARLLRAADAEPLHQVYFPYCVDRLQAWPDALRRVELEAHHIEKMEELPAQAWLARELMIRDKTVPLTQWRRLLEHPCWAELCTLRLEDVRFGGQRGFEVLCHSKLFERLSHLRLFDIKIDAKLLKTLLEAPALDGLRTLELERARLDHDAVLALLSCEALAGLARLNLRDNRLTSPQYALLADGGALENLRVLCLGARPDDPRHADRHAYYNRSGRGGLTFLTQASGLGRLEGLDLSYHQLVDADVKRLAGAHEHLPALRTLDLRSNYIRSSGARALVTSELGLGLSRLDLSWNTIGARATAALAKTPRAISLEHLKLTRTNPGVSGRRALFTSEYLGQLHTLELGDCEVDPESLRALDPDRLPALRHLDLSSNHLSGVDLVDLLRRPVFDQLTHLDLSYAKTLRSPDRARLEDDPGCLDRLEHLRIRAVDGAWYEPPIVSPRLVGEHEVFADLLDLR